MISKSCRAKNSLLHSARPLVVTSLPTLPNRLIKKLVGISTNIGFLGKDFLLPWQYIGLFVAPTQQIINNDCHHNNCDAADSEPPQAK